MSYSIGNKYFQNKILYIAKQNKTKNKTNKTMDLHVFIYVSYRLVNCHLYLISGTDTDLERKIDCIGLTGTFD